MSFITASSEAFRIVFVFVLESSSPSSWNRLFVFLSECPESYVKSFRLKMRCLFAPPLMLKNCLIFIAFVG